MSPLNNPQYVAEAETLVVAVGKIKKAIKENGFGTVATMILLSEALTLAASVTTFNNLPKEQRDEFMAEVWDAAIGEEENALIKKIGMFEGEYLEVMSDGMKGAALAYFNKEVPLLPA